MEYEPNTTLTNLFIDEEELSTYTKSCFEIKSSICHCVTLLESSRYSIKNVDIVENTGAKRIISQCDTLQVNSESRRELIIPTGAAFPSSYLILDSCSGVRVSLPRLPDELVALIPHWDTKQKTLDLTPYTSPEANSVTVQATCDAQYFRYDVHSKVIECLASNDVKRWEDLVLVTVVKGVHREHSFITVSGGVEYTDKVPEPGSRSDHTDIANPRFYCKGNRHTSSKLFRLYWHDVHDESVISKFEQDLTSKTAAKPVLLWANDHNVDFTTKEELIYYFYEFRDAVGRVEASILVCVR
jgi:hypothetical protein